MAGPNLRVILIHVFIFHFKHYHIRVVVFLLEYLQNWIMEFRYFATITTFPNSQNRALTFGGAKPTGYLQFSRIFRRFGHAKRVGEYGIFIKVFFY